jgi:hypothetical protein
LGGIRIDQRCTRVQALMEIPDQYKTVQKLGLLGKAHFSRPAPSVAVVPLGAGAQATGSSAQAGAAQQQWPPHQV